MLTIPAQTIYLVGYDAAKHVLSKNVNAPSAAIHLSAGFCAEVLSGLVWTPMVEIYLFRAVH